MRGLCCYISVLVMLAALPGCSKADAYSNETRTIDSLSGALNALIRELEKTDTILLQKSVTRFHQYERFIRQHIQDTIEKTDADNLQHFYTGGQSLEQYAENRKAILARARLINFQLSKLSADIKNAAPEPETLKSHIGHEMQAAAGVMEAGSEQQRNYHSRFEEFKTALHGVEALIRSRNRGELPVIIKDTVNL